MSAVDDVSLEYLAEVCREVGRPLAAAPLRHELLDGGRTGAEVVRLSVGATSFVLKSVPKASWRGPGMERLESGEPCLWRDGIVGDVPGPIRWPVLDVRDAPSGAFSWMLMEDVGPGIRPRGGFPVEDSRTLFDALATMHAAFYGDERLRAAPLPDVVGVTRLFTTPLARIRAGVDGAEPWVPQFLDNFKVMGVLAPLFLECLGPALADAYLQMVADDGWKRRMGALPRTLLHGDLRRANISFGDEGDLALFDWELACAGPPGCDLQWHCFLHYWAYPPGDDDDQPACDALFAEYRTALASRLGGALDPAELAQGWALGWIKVIAQLGYVLVDPLYPGGGTDDLRARVSDRCRRAVTRALEFVDATP